MMKRIYIPEHLQNKQGRLIQGDVYWVDVKLHDGRLIRGLISQGEFLVGKMTASDGARECELPFTTADIKKVRPHSILPFLW
jgi:hypothetical protein